MTADEQRQFTKQLFAGVTLFTRNIPPDISHLRSLNHELQSLYRGDLPCIIAIDQEGGRVRRIRGSFPDPGPALRIADGKWDDAAIQVIQDWSKRVHLELENLGINVNFAPVCDLFTEPTNTAIGDRVFGQTLEQALPRIAGFLAGMETTSVHGCLKHFPGQGDAAADTHLQACHIRLSEQQLRARELAAFRPFLHRVPMVMLSHCVYPVWDHVPASTSSKIAQQLLRSELGFDGLIVSDDMVMSAIPQDTQEWQQSLISAIAAGVDLLLVCRDLDRMMLAVDAIENEARKSSSFARRLEDAALRVDRFRKSYLR